MNDLVEFIAAVERSKDGSAEVEARVPGGKPSIGDLPVHGFPGKSGRGAGLESQNPHPVLPKDGGTRVGHPPLEHPLDALPVEGNGYGERLQREPEEERERRIYRGRTVGMLRRYMRYSIETGRLPSLLGREFFRSKVTSYTVVTFEDRVIFVHDMERCLERLDEFGRQLIARYILQEHDRWATARLLNCNEKTIRRQAPVVLDQLSEILLEVGLMARLEGK
jgi:hypothetical protein